MKLRRNLEGLPTGLFVLPSGAEQPTLWVSRLVEDGDGVPPAGEDLHVVASDDPANFAEVPGVRLPWPRPRPN